LKSLELKQNKINFSLILWLIFLVILLILIGLPLFELIKNSFSSPEGNLTLANYISVLLKPRFTEAIANSLILATGSSILSLMIGVPTAWLVTCTDLPWKGLIRSLLLLVFAMPPFLSAICWILLIAPQSGWLNRIYLELTGAKTGIFNAYSMAGAIFVIGFSLYPYVFSLTSSALESLNSELEDAATILGATRWERIIKITLPIVSPAIIAGGILSFLEAIALFGSPSLLLIPARVKVITTEIWQLFQYPPQIEVACAFSILLIFITVLLLWLQRSLFAGQDLATITGKAVSKNLLYLGLWRWGALAFCLFICSLSLFLPVLVLLKTAFSTSWGRDFGVGNLTFNWFYEVLTDSSTFLAVKNSLLFSSGAAVLAMGISIIIAYITNRQLVKGSQILSFIPMIPLAIPGVVMAIAIFSAYTQQPLVLYGTAAIMIIAFTTRFLPVAFTNTQTTFKSINSELELAARNLGASSVTTLQKIVLPLSNRGLIRGWLLVFILSIRELSSAIFLFTLNTQVMTTELFEMVSESSYEKLSALGLIMLGVVFLVVLSANKLLVE
jgi:iron(III) transport system permease protein